MHDCPHRAGARLSIRLTAIMLPVSVALVALFMSYLLRPVGALKRGLERIGRGQLDSPMPVPRPERRIRPTSWWSIPAA